MASPHRYATAHSSARAPPIIRRARFTTEGEQLHKLEQTLQLFRGRRSGLFSIDTAVTHLVPDAAHHAYFALIQTQSIA